MRGWGGGGVRCSSISNHHRPPARASHAPSLWIFPGTSWVSSNPIIFIEVTLKRQKTNLFKVNSSVTFSMCVKLYSPDPCLVNRFHPKKRLLSIQQLLSTSLSPQPLEITISFLSLWICLFCCSIHPDLRGPASFI